MTVKEFSEVVNVKVEEIIRKLENISLDEDYNENSVLDDVTGKKLAKSYDLSWPIKTKKSQPKSTQEKPSSKVVVNIKQPETKKPQTNNQPTPKQTSPKPNPTSTPNNQQPKPQNQTQNTQPKPQNQQNNKPVNNGQNNSQNKPGNNQNKPSGNGNNYNNQNKYNNGQNNNQNKPGNNQNKPSGNGNQNKPNNNQNKPNNNQPKPQNQQPKPRPKMVEDEVIESRFDDLDKYENFENDDFNESQKTKNKSKMRQNDSNQKKKQQNKSRAEKRAGNINHVNEENVVYYETNMTVMDVAEAMNISVTELVKKLFTSMGIFASATQSIDRETVELIALEYNYEVKNKVVTDLVRFDEIEIVDKEEDLKPRPAIVTIMGHVDHGKTTLLDYIRSSHVTAGEAGGITQHIGAYQVTKDGHVITFIDTPGHAAFTEMRARGAQVTDIVILVVAADDGVMPQTIEAIEHAQSAGVPIIVAVNKMDKPGMTADRIKEDLMKYNLISEEWGGDTIFVPISAKYGQGVPELLEMVNLVSDLKEYKANPSRLAVGTVIEAKLDKGRGPVATLLVQNGTLNIGDIIVVGTTYGKVRAMNDEYGRPIKQAGPAKPVEVTGLDQVPFAGEKFMALDDEKSAKAVAEIRAQNKSDEELNSVSTASLQDLAAEGDLKVLNLIIKCDVQGSIEAIRGLLEKIEIEGTKINIVGARVGAITDNDISLAIASHAIIIGFNIRPNSQITELAKDKKVEIRLYNIIYKLQEDIEQAVKGMLDPVFEEKVIGEAEVREIFKISKVGTIAGSMVTKGEIRRNSKVRIIRDSIVVYTGHVGGLRRFKDDVKEVKEGYDCGISVENYNDIKVGDVFECFVMEEQER